MIRPNIHNETALLKSVVLGTANDFGGTPKLEDCYDPKSKQHVVAGTYPTNEDCIKEMDALVAVFDKYDVKVYRPENIKGLNQIFSRDIAFVIEDKLILPNIIEDRAKEVDAVSHVLSQISEENKTKMPASARAEGGDVMPWHEYVFVGYSEKEDFEKYTVARTNRAGLEFLAKTFPNKQVKGFELNKSDIEPKENALHLDCCFQPVGKDKAILHKNGFLVESEYQWLIDFFGKENVFEISKEEMYNMNSNIFSISEDVVISEQNFTRLNTWLRENGITVEEVPYSEIAKQEGLLRCSTMPLIRD